MKRLEKYNTQKIGEHLVVAELHKRGIIAAIVSGEAKGFDLLLDRFPFKVEVKTRQTSKKMTPISFGTKSPKNTICPIICALIHINKDYTHTVAFYIIPVEEIKRNTIAVPKAYGKEHPLWKGRYHLDKDDIVQFKDRWDLIFNGEVK